MTAQHNTNHAGAPGAPDEAQLERDFADVIEPLRRLGRTIDGASLPQPAWPARRGRGAIHRVLVASAAAAAILLAVAAGYWLGAHRGGRDDERRIAATAPAGDPNEQAVGFSVPTRVDPSIASQVTWRVPSVWMPSTVDANGLHLGWLVPPLSFPSFETGAAAAKPGASSQPKPT